jgi:hypothetical protein
MNKVFFVSLLLLILNCFADYDRVWRNLARRFGITVQSKSNSKICKKQAGRLAILNMMMTRAIIAPAASNKIDGKHLIRFSKVFLSPVLSPPQAAGRNLFSSPQLDETKHYH